MTHHKPNHADLDSYMTMLPPHHISILRLIAISGYSYKQVGHHVGLSSKAVYRIVQQARETYVRCFADTDPAASVRRILSLIAYYFLSTMK